MNTGKFFLGIATLLGMSPCRVESKLQLTPAESNPAQPMVTGHMALDIPSSNFDEY